jgi:UDP:flavonoid glycosyltransferase YjiC (YdhE family)
MKILFVVFDGGGNIPPQLAVARSLRARGAEVRFLGHHGVRRRVEAEGFPFETFKSGTNFDPTVQQPLLRMMASMVRVAMDWRLGREAVGAAHRHHTDVVVVDVLLTAAIYDVAAQGIPTVVFGHCFHRTIQDLAAGPIGWVMRLRGIPPDRLERTGALQIVTAYAGQRRMLQRILDAIEPLPVRATVTIGPAIESSGLRVPANCSLHAWLDHDEVLATASLVVGHGGHSTAMRALSFGVPQVIMPANTLIDQRRVGAAIQNLGAGILLRKHAGVRRIRAAISTVLQDPAYRESAEIYGDQLRRCDGAEVAATAIDEFTKASAAHATRQGR